MNPGDSFGSDSAAEQQGKHRTGLFTLLFTDVAGSTQLKAALGDQSGVTLIQSHHALVRELLRSFTEAEEISTAGDSFLLVFARPSDALRFALRLQGRLRAFNEGRQVKVEDRIGLHMGEVVLEDRDAKRDIHGMQVDTCARVMSLARAGQILMTRPVFDNARQSLKGEDVEGVGSLSWLNHGRFALKGVEEPLEICEVRPAEAEAISAPTTSDKVHRVEAAEGEAVLGWRPAVGQVVPNTKWILEEKLGEGGFGEVWLGRHQTMKERRVFKFCFHANRVRSLKREMTLFRLIKERIGDHPNIVSLREVYFDQPPYYVEEDYAQARDLATWCAAQGGADKVASELKLEIVAQVADALQAAHDAGVIHRDVKPANILVNSQRSVVGVQKEQADSSPLPLSASLTAKLTDFGIGQVISEELLAGVTKAGFTHTMLASSSSQTGTQMYMAPELLAGKPATTRSDIYSLGVVLYQLLVGDFRQPVATDWGDDITDSLLREDLRHCVAGKPADRFVGAGQLAKNLRAYAERKAELGRQRAEAAERERLRQQAAQRHRVAIFTGGVAVVLLLLAITLGFGIQRAEKQRRRAEAYLYDADMNLAGQALQQNNRGLALSFLDLHRPAKPGQRDLRGWEWRYLWEKCRSDELATLGQHDGIVQSVAFSPDGKWAASGGYDGLVKIWGLPSGAAGERCITNLQLGGGPVSSVAFSPDGRWLAARTWTNGFVVFQAPGWQREMTVTNAETGPYGGSVAFSPDGRLLAVGGDVWSLDTHTRFRTVPCRQFDWGDPAVAWLRDSHTLAGFGQSNDVFRVQLFDVGSTNQDAAVPVIPLRAERGRSPMPTSLAFSPDEKHLAVGCWDSTIRIHAASDWGQVRLLTNHTAWVSSLAFSRDGQWLASASADHSIKVWRTRDWRETVTLRGHLEEVWAVAFTPDGQRLVTASKDHSVRLWPVAGRSRPIEEALMPAESLRGYGLSGACPFTVGSSNDLSIWDGQTLQVRQRLASYPVANITGGRPSPDGRLLLMATAEGGLWLMDLAPGAVPSPVSLQTNGSRLKSAAFSDRARWLAVADGDALRVWSLKHQPPRPGLALAAGDFRALHFSPDERLLVGVTGPIMTDQTVLVWDAASGKELVRFQPHRDAVNDLDCSPDGAMLATASNDNTCKLFDLRRRREVTTLRGHLLSLFSVCFSPDGRRLAAHTGGTGTTSSGIIIWDLATEREVLFLKTHETGYGAVRFHPSGDSLLSMSRTALRLWRAPPWDEIEARQRTVASHQMQP